MTVDEEHEKSRDRHDPQPSDLNEQEDHRTTECRESRPCIDHDQTGDACGLGRGEEGIEEWQRPHGDRRREYHQKHRPDRYDQNEAQQYDPGRRHKEKMKTGYAMLERHI